jgi:transcriptional regulator with XRE-family HTH domain
MSQISDKIRANRLRARFTREQIANLLNMHPEDYIKLETGEKDASLNQLEDFFNLYFASNSNREYWFGKLKVVKKDDE